MFIHNQQTNLHYYYDYPQLILTRQILINLLLNQVVSASKTLKCSTDFYRQQKNVLFCQQLTLIQQLPSIYVSYISAILAFPFLVVSLRDGLLILFILFIYAIILSLQLFNRPSLRETTKNGKAKMADMYETYIDGSYYIRVKYWQNTQFFCCLQKSVEHLKLFEAETS